MAFVTIRDVAREAGVSITAVSQILHGKGRFSDETREHVLSTVERLGYVPDRRARSMRSSETNTVGLLVPDLRNPYFADLVSAMEDELYRRGYTTLVGTSGENVARQDGFIENLLGQRIDGAIVVPQGVESPGVKSLIARDLPLVFVDRRVQGVDSVPFVISDPYPGILSAIRDLTRLGHTRIGFVAHPSLGSFSVNERRTAFEAIAAGSDGTIDPVVVSCDSTYESRKEALASLRDAGVSAIICAYSPDAITMIGLLHDADVEIGRAVSLVSFDDISAFRLMTPSISVISQQVDSMGLQGVAMLLDQIASKESRKGGTHYVPTVFVPRGSTGPALR
ncbi:LacI family DNA-binding transcriptional regulator [Bifidobacterium samirii]|uniref:LacI family transcriptional regulator n=1 Tax=Bifidobacterium samirii TaxID=2306974 RepID=A0A430FW52_9BIFI|nr:LacI family DNA-binding transcriptional regulator [Bifidobacterium samirii]RSX58162.1 LacI family transcriptional regulator [Bifidobacterium samirii]